MKAAGGFETGVAGVAEGLVQGDGRGVGEVQRAFAFDHRDADAEVRMPDKQLFRQTGALFAEHQKVAVPVIALGHGLFGLGGQIPDAGARMRPVKIVQTVIFAYPQARPVVQARPAYAFFIGLKAQRPDEMKAGPGTEAGPADGPGVAGLFGLVKDEIDAQFFRVRRRMSVP